MRNTRSREPGIPVVHDHSARPTIRRSWIFDCWQECLPGVVSVIDDRTGGVRSDSQPLGSREHRWRFQRWRSGCSRCWSCSDRARERRDWFVTVSCRSLRRRDTQAEPRSDSDHTADRSERSAPGVDTVRGCTRCQRPRRLVPHACGRRDTASRVARTATCRASRPRSDHRPTCLSGLPRLGTSTRRPPRLDGTRR